MIKILERKPLLYARGADRALDRPAHVRASSALVWLRDKLVVVQDDAAFLGIVDPATGLVDDVPFAQAPRTWDKARDNKEKKPDLESVFADGDTLIAFGSGGPLAARRIVVTWRVGETPQLIPVPRLFETLTIAAMPQDCALNLEGAVLDGDTVILANRGGDQGRSPDALFRMARGDLRALLADPDHAPTPPLDVELIDLGDLDGAALHFTELTPHRSGLLYLAVAEETSSYFDDGAVRGSVIGRLDGDQLGTIPGAKLEGLAADPRDPKRLYAVTDPDDPRQPGELLILSFGVG